MPDYTVNMIYLGNFDEFDTVESTPQKDNYVNENQTVAGWEPGTVFTHRDMKLLEVGQSDTDQIKPTTGETASNRLEEDDYEKSDRTVNPGTYGPYSADTMTYDTGSGQTTQKLDSTFIWNATVNPDSDDPITGKLVFVQMENGDVFIVGGVENRDALTLDNLNIQSIRLDSFDRGDWFGTTPNQSIDNTTIICFVAGTMIRTRAGECAIEGLSVGDLIPTKDNGHQPIRWIGSTRIDAAALRARPSLRPIRIRAGALAENTPDRDLLVSPQHRVLVRSRIAQRMFGTMEVLVAAKHLLTIDGIEIAGNLSGVEYFHMLFDRHEVVYSNGAATESLYTGSWALKSVGAAARREIFTLFPELRAHHDAGIPPVSARPLVDGPKAQILAGRHLRNNLRLWMTG